MLTRGARTQIHWEAQEGARIRVCQKLQGMLGRESPRRRYLRPELLKTGKDIHLQDRAVHRLARFKSVNHKRAAVMVVWAEMMQRFEMTIIDHQQQ